MLPLLAALTLNSALLFAGKNDLYNAIVQSKKLKNPLQDIEKLLKAGANPNGDEEDKIPLIFAARLGNSEIATILLAYKADVNKKNDLGNTALNVALWKNDPDMVKFLLENKADPNTLDTEKNSPLDLLASGTYSAFNAVSLKMLLDAGAHINMKGQGGLTPLERAKKADNKAFLQAADEWLQEYVKREQIDKELQQKQLQDFKNHTNEILEKVYAAKLPLETGSYISEYIKTYGTDKQNFWEEAILKLDVEDLKKIYDAAKKLGITPLANLIENKTKSHK